MDERIRVSVNKMIVHKRIHEYLKEHASKVPVKVEQRDLESNSNALEEKGDNKKMEREPGEIKEESMREEK